MKTDREPLTADVIGIVVGLGMIAVAIARFGNDIEYLPDDPRSQPWFDPLFSSIGVVVGILVLLLRPSGCCRGSTAANEP